MIFNEISWKHDRYQYAQQKYDFNEIKIDDEEKLFLERKKKKKTYKV